MTTLGPTPDLSGLVKNLRQARMEQDLRDFLGQVEGMMRLNRTLNNRDVRPYHTVEGFVLTHGFPMTWAKAPRELKQGPPKQCFSNSATTLLLPDNYQGRYRYCEGFVYRESLAVPVNHAWLTPEAGAGAGADAYDRTIVPDKDELIVYYGCVFQTSYVIDTAARRGQWGSLLDAWPERWPLLRDAEAWRAALIPQER